MRCRDELRGREAGRKVHDNWIGAPNDGADEDLYAGDVMSGQGKQPLAGAAQPPHVQRVPNATARTLSA